MSFKFEWPVIEPIVIEEWKAKLSDALNSSKDRPPIVPRDIIISDLSIGDVAPEITILEISEVSMRRLKGMFRIEYYGNAFIELKTFAQANPLPNLMTQPQQRAVSRLNIQALSADAEDLQFTFNNFKAQSYAAKPFFIPVTIKIHSLQLNALCTLDMDMDNGICLHFINDIVQDLKVNTVFDESKALGEFISNKLKSEICDFLNNKLPQLIYEATKNIKEKIEPVVKPIPTPTVSPTISRVSTNMAFEFTKHPVKRASLPSLRSLKESNDKGHNAATAINRTSTSSLRQSSPAISSHGDRVLNTHKSLLSNLINRTKENHTVVINPEINRKHLETVDGSSSSRLKNNDLPYEIELNTTPNANELTSHIESLIRSSPSLPTNNILLFGNIQERLTHQFNPFHQLFHTPNNIKKK